LELVEVDGAMRGKDRIAVLNNDTAYLELLYDLLSDEGYDVLLWKEGSNAYQELEKELPDLIIFDIGIEQPENSLSILELLKLDSRTCAIPVIDCSADVQALHAIEEDCHEHTVRTLPKPFDLDDLLWMIASSLEERKQSEILRDERDGT
jgi:two-component system, NtrC family, nitrogen regulation response regulator NtrX